MKEKISVIVPIYNAEKNLSACIQSILRQSYKNLEILLVNDGAEDDSLNICESYAKEDQRIQILSQKNSGVSAARISGMRKATGDYLAFVDADDYLDESYFEELLQEIQRADMVSARFFCTPEIAGADFDKFEAGRYSGKKLAYLIENMLQYHYSDVTGLSPYIWNKLYRKNIVDKIVKDLNRKVFIGEDSEFVYRYVLQSKAIVISNICGYHYRNSENSIVHSTHEQYLNNLNELYCSLRDCFMKHPQKESLLLQLQIRTGLGITAASRVMGFSRLAYAYPINIFPKTNELCSKKIVLYGAGRLGIDYYRLFTKKKIEIVQWVDQKAGEKGILKQYLQDRVTVSKDQMDFIILAVKDKKMADEISNELQEKGYPKKKILWEEPITLE